MDEKDRYKRYLWYLKQVEPYDGYEVDDYYGTQHMKVKRNGLYEIRLQYDYSGSHPQNGSKFVVETLEELLEWIGVLEFYAKDKSTTNKIKKYVP